MKLVTEWQLDAPVESVWDQISRPEDWPIWWRAVRRVQLIAAGGADGVGTVRRFTWTTALPYTLTFDMETTQIEPMRLLEGRARGELDGVGRWTFAANGKQTLLRYDWHVELTRAWMRALAPILRPVFAWNHNVVMGWGHEGLAKRLRQRA